MSEIQNAIRELSTILKEITLPAGFLESYDQLECLSHSHGTETYLVQHKGSKNLCVAKCYDRKIYKTVNENGILKSLCHKGLPAFLDEYQDDATVFICFLTSVTSFPEVPLPIFSCAVEKTLLLSAYSVSSPATAGFKETAFAGQTASQTPQPSQA